MPITEGRPATHSFTPAVLQWLRESNVPITHVDAAATAPDLDSLIRAIGDATVLGLGESTRAASETFTLRDRIWRALVQQRGFRALAIQDSPQVVERYDRFVSLGEGDPKHAVSQAWPPWRHVEMVQALEWIRQFNVEHPHDPVRLFAVQDRSAQPADYDAVTDYVAAVAPEQSQILDSHLAPIRTAHDIDEHVQLHRGIHPGQPFAEHARDAHRLVIGLADDSDHYREALRAADAIVQFHENSPAAKNFTMSDAERRAAQTIAQWHETTGDKIVYWDGIAHLGSFTAAGNHADIPSSLSAGAQLRRYFGRRYISVAIGFHHGRIHHTEVPEPQSDFMDSVLGEITSYASYLNLRAQASQEVDRWLTGPNKARVISGMYTEAADADSFISIDSLASTFDVLVHISQISPTQTLTTSDTKR